MSIFNCSDCAVNGTDACKFGADKTDDYSEYCNDLLVEQEYAYNKGRADVIANVKDMLGCFEHDCENCFYREGTMCKLNLII